MVGALVMSMGVVLLGALPASAATEHCPSDYRKVDAKKGSAKGPFGELSWQGTSLEHDLNSGYTLSICLKVSTYTHTESATGIGSVDTPPNGPRGQQQGISYIAYKVTGEPSDPQSVPYGSIDEIDLCGRANDRLELPDSPDDNGVTYDRQADDGLNWSVLISAPEGLLLRGEQSRTKTVSGAFTDEECPTALLPAVPDVDSSRCLNGSPTAAVIQVPTDTEDVDYEPSGSNAVTATINLETHSWNPETPDRWVIDGAVGTYTFTPDELAPANCDTTTTTTVSDERKSCARGVEVRSGTVTTVNGQAQPPRWGSWTSSRGLNNAEFEQLGCRPDQPQPVELLGSETRMDCAGVEERTSTQVTTFVWSETTREYNKVVGETKWSDWVKTRNLTTKELRAEGCVLGEETLVPTPKPDKKPTKVEPTVKGVERVAPSAAVPTAVAAGASAAAPSAMTQLLAQLLVGGGMLLLLAGGWIGFGRREGGAHEA